MSRHGAKPYKENATFRSFLPRKFYQLTVSSAGLQDMTSEVSRHDVKPYKENATFRSLLCATDPQTVPKSVQGLIERRSRFITLPW